MELGDKGSFQAVKLQRLARTTVCSHSAMDMATTFHRIHYDHDESQNECLSFCEQYEYLSGRDAQSGRARRYSLPRTIENGASLY
jgi:hypothetical protein